MKRHLIRPRNALLAALTTLMVPMASMTSVQAMTTSPVYQEAAGNNGPYTITLTSTNAGSLKGRKFNLYKIFDLTTGTGGAFNYTFTSDANTQKAVQKAVYRTITTGVGEGAQVSDDQAKTITIAKALDTIAGLTDLPESETGKIEGQTSRMRKFSETLRKELAAANVTPQTQSVTENSSTYQISGLTKGYYLIDEEVAQPSASSEPDQGHSLCLMLTVDDNQELELKGVYPTIHKQIQEDDHKDTLGSDGWNDIGDYEIGQTIPYRYQIGIPNISGYKTYTLVIHDKMDAALNFQSDSIAITVKGTSADSGKTYSLQASDYQIKTPGITQGNTFEIVISDIKGIIDQKIYGAAAGAPAADHPYGQTIEVTYNAKLSETAASNPGRPGFENNVRLEYSNDPDSDGQGTTGFTPWDTVVAFTFQIDGVKVAEPKSEGDTPQPLAGAHFRLYRDQDCKNEIRLKKVTDGYAIQSEATTDGAELVTEANGNIKIFGLDQGTYYLKETQAPDGYHGPLTPLKLDITPTYTENRNNYTAGEGKTDKILKQLNAKVSYIESVNGDQQEIKDQVVETEVGNGSVQLQVVNRTGKELPLTGSNTAWISMAAGSVLVIGGLSMTLQKKKKN
ncbi:isopeptide-forming domain-containing fimbrial protein [Erysipelotrichaceae bacterium RD49]|nr:isopeptide-forming domain-containing fimbrial protein [Erysipelotrichaceae bacterium RD49]